MVSYIKRTSRYGTSTANMDGLKVIGVASVIVLSSIIGTTGRIDLFGSSFGINYMFRFWF